MTLSGFAQREWRVSATSFSVRPARHLALAVFRPVLSVGMGDPQFQSGANVPFRTAAVRGLAMNPPQNHDFTED